MQNLIRVGVVGPDGRLIDISGTGMRLKRAWMSVRELWLID